MKTTISFLFILVFSFGVLGQQKFSAKVQVYVQHTSSNSQKDVVASNINRELRSLGDVQIVAEGGDYLIEVLMVDSIANGRVIGYAYSLSFEKNALCVYKEKYVDGASVTSECNALQSSSIGIMSTDKVKESAQAISAKFDSQILEPARQFFEINKPMKKN